MLSLDLSFYNWELFTNYILKGLLFSVQLTVIATVGGIVVGTFLALMRLSGKPALVYPATFYVNTMRSIPLVMVILWFFLLIPMLIGKPGQTYLPPLPLLHLRPPSSRRLSEQAFSRFQRARFMQVKLWE